ncbi:hypothetical protein LINGRAHAP2_LOCUS9116 [Linum grandiflorum]
MIHTSTTHHQPKQRNNPKQKPQLFQIIKDPHTYIRHIAIDQKSNDNPHPAVASVQTDNPTPISLKGLTLQEEYIIV